MIIGVGLTYPREKLAWLESQGPLILLAVTFAALAAGGILQLAGAAGAGDAAWLAAGACGAAYALWAMADALRQGRAGVDVIALLALLGAMAVGELLAAAVISVMLASGRALEAWAAGRADRDLRALLERAPRTARRYSAGRWWWCRSTRSGPATCCWSRQARSCRWTAPWPPRLRSWTSPR